MRGSDRKISARTCLVADVSPALRQQLYLLFVAAYDGVSRQKFMQDLDRKSHVIILSNRSGEPCGFSTIVEFERHFADAEIRLIFNGDTVISPDYWGSTALFGSWLDFVLDRQSRNSPVETYWLLTTKGHRVFRTLPLFFRRFWPSWSHEYCDNGLEPLAARIGLAEFPDRYDPATGVLSVSEQGERLSKDLADIPDKDVVREDVRFFLKANPGYRQGNELLCLARVSRQNLSPYALRYVGRT